jgi:hypothetical protein
MSSYDRPFILCLLCMSVALGCASHLAGPTTPSGYLFRLQLSHQQLWIERTRDSLVYPSAATLVVQVQDAQGRSVNNVPVSFRVHGNGAYESWLSPTQAITQGGSASSLFQPATIGVYYVTVQVEQTSQQAVIYVNQRDLCCFCQAWAPGHACGKGP